jgi:hypothetical protein
VVEGVISDVSIVSMSVTLSFTPGEVVNAGTILEIRAPRPVDPQSAVVRLLRAGEPVLAPVSVQSNIVQVSTAGLSPASYQLVVVRLLDTNQQPVTDRLVFPITIGSLSGSIPKEIRVEQSVHLAIGDIATTTLTASNKVAPAGTEYLELVKASHRVTNAPVELAFNAQGQRVDGQAALEKISKRRAAKFGRMHETLFEKLKKLGDNDEIEVAVWPKLDGSLTDVGDRESKEALFAQRQKSDTAKNLRSKLTSVLKGLNAKVRDGPEDIPRVTASLTVAGVRKLAQSNDIGAVFLDDSTGVLDLQQSLNITRTPAAHTLGYDGNGVKVAVFELGPKDTTNLQFAGRYSTTPTDSSHARLTSAIIKNTEPNRPHGHAPACSLYSANSDDNNALLWAAQQGCTVISQSFHRPEEETSSTLSSDDVLKDWMALRFPFPLIAQAAGNESGIDGEYVNHKGYNTLSVGSHDDNATAMAASSISRNPATPHGDRELPEISANGTGVTAVGVSLSGTSFAAPVVAGIAALIQQAHASLKAWPEGCRAILLASAGRNVVGGTWRDDRSSGIDARDGSGATDAEAAVKIAEVRATRNGAAIQRGWDGGYLTSTDIGTDNLALFRYYVQVPNITGLVVKVALTCSSKVATDASGNPTSSTLTVDLDLWVREVGSTALTAFSSTWDNSYEIVEFAALPGKAYEIVIRRFSGTDPVYYGVAWTVLRLGQSLPFLPALSLQV